MTQLTASPPSDAAKLDAACAKGMELQLAGQLEGASGLYEAVLQASPGHPAANYCLGMLLVQSQRAVDALPYLKAALLAGLEVPDYWLGYLEALILAGRTTAARNTLALGCQHGLAGAAVEDLARRLEVKLAEGAAPPAAKITAPAPMAPEQAPPPPAAARLAGPPAAPAKRAPSGRKGEQLARKEEDRLLSLLGSPDKAQILALARGLTERFPQRGLGWKILGAFMSTEGGLEEALPVLEKAVRLLPNDAEAHVNLGVTLAKTKSFKEAEAHLRTALRLDPGLAAAHYRLGMTYELQGRYAEAEKSLREGRAIGLKSKNVAGDDELSYSHLLFIASHNPSIGPAELYAEHRQYGEAIEGPRRASWPRHANPREPERRLKVGFVSGDLHEHSVGQFLEPIVARLKTRPGLELHAYRTNPVEDALSRRLQSHFRSWTSVGAFTDDRLASKIQEDKIDVLIDLSGHTGHNRLPVFARKPAPVQVSWLGYPGTTGLGAMDYYLADRCWLPPGRFDGMFTEKLVYLPDRWAFRTHADAPAVGPLPALETGALTFGSFHRLGKINAATVELWSRLLLALPRSILRVAGIPVNGPQQALLDQFAAHGIGPERVTCHARSTMDVYLAFHNQVDIALDTLAYSGATTTMHSLSMGVPTLTVAGATPQARACAGILTNLGLEAFVAADAADFLDKARHWAGRLGELAELRRQLRARVQRSPGGQPEFIAAHLEAAMRHMWRGWCANLPPRVFDTSLLERPADAVLAGAAAPAGPAVATGVPWQSIPIILNNRNRFDSLRRMVDWLLAAGCRDIRILDNDSEYAPLLAYYAALPGRVTVQKLGENIGPWAFWKLGLHRLMSTPYIVSDADLVPADYCPTDLIARLAAVADRYPDCGKVAPGLRLDTISPAYGQSRAAFQWESRYWSKPVAPGLFAAPVDTTFALYQPGAEFTIRGENLRLGHPYLLEHMPWQVDESALGEEELFYRAHTSKAFSHWSSSTIDPRIAANKWIRQFSERKTVLHLGCGDEYIPGWINIDAQGPRCDIRFDIENCAGQRLPLADDSADGFYLCHVFHRVKDPLALMQELHRVARPGATIHMRLPYGSSDDAWADGAARPYFDSSFTRFSGPAHRSGGRDYAADWQPTRVTLIVDPALLALGREEALRQIRAGRNQVAEMVVELTAVKPARPCSPGSPIPCEILLSSDQRVPPVFHEMEDL